VEEVVLEFEALGRIQCGGHRGCGLLLAGEKREANGKRHLVLFCVVFKGLSGLLCGKREHLVKGEKA